LGFPTGRSFTSSNTRHQQVFWHHSTPRHQQVFWRRCRGIEEEEAPTSTIFSHVNYAPAKCQSSFLAPLPGKNKTPARGVSHAHPLLCFKFGLLYFCLHRFIKNTKKLVSY
jgi:hypothetical protein